MSLRGRPYEDRWGPRRARLIAGALACLFVVIVGRSAYVAVNGPGPNAGRAVAESVRRADIVDRKGDLLATSLAVWSIAADPRAIWDGKEVATSLATVLPGIDVADLTKRLSDTDRHFVWIQRGITPRQKQAVFELGLEGLQFQQETRRVYPRGTLAGHFLGFTNVDGKGVEGAELAFNDRLARGGEPLKLTLDAGVQFTLEDELEKAYADFDMKGGAGVILDAATGEVRAIASWPAIDPNHPQDRTELARMNRAIGATYELGSIYKPLTVAAALEAGVLSTSETFDVSKPVKVGATPIKDHDPMPHPQAVTAADIIAFSSNIGAVEIAKKLGVGKQKEFLTSVGLLSRPSYDGPQSAAPIPPPEWDALASATISYGHGIAVTPLAFAAAYTPFANGGEYVKPIFLDPKANLIDVSKIEKKRVMTKATAEIVISMMREVVTRGTGKNAEAPGYDVAGKTGTAEKIGPDGYDSERNITSFAAVFPASRPQFVVLVMLDEAQPRTGDARTAAYTAASIAGRVIARAAPLLDVQPVLKTSAVEAASLRASEAVTP
jgi:cell division protein FtsI (penicillin-binding protein 3)